MPIKKRSPLKLQGDLYTSMKNFFEVVVLSLTQHALERVHFSY